MQIETHANRAEMHLSELLSVAEAAALLRVSPRTIRNRIRAGLLPARTLTGSRTIRVDRQDVMAQWHPVSAGSRAASPGKLSPLVDRLSTPEGRARALAALDAPTEGDALEQRDILALLTQAGRESPLTLRDAVPQEHPALSPKTSRTP